MAQKVQVEAHDRLAGIVSKCLKAVFGPDAYEFRILFEKKRGRTEARLAFFREGQEIDPIGAAGGGVLDVAALALRLAALVASRPRLRRLLVLDEPMRFLHKDVLERVGKMLETLAEELGVQFILTTHLEGLRVGKVIELK